MPRRFCSMRTGNATAFLADAEVVLYNDFQSSEKFVDLLTRYEKSDMMNNKKTDSVF